MSGKQIRKRQPARKRTPRRTTTPPPAEKPRRMTLSQVLEGMLARTGERSSVTLARTAGGETAIEVKVRTGDQGDITTVEHAEQKAREVYERLRDQYPHTDAGHDAATVSLTRNAKGETQVAVEVKTAAHSSVRTLEDAAGAVSEAYESACAQFPLSSGYTRAPLEKVT